MDSWTLQGDSYSFLRSAPRALSLCHRDGTPNHVEIFDITSVPNQRSAISETTCLCDIFGDDRESPSLTSSSIAGPFVPSQREADGIVASPLADDLNDSSGSYHSAQGFSEGDEGFEDSRERLCSPPLQGDLPPRTQPLDTEHQENTTNSNTNLEPKSRSPSSFNSTSPTLGVSHSRERTPSPGQNSQYTLDIEGRASSLSSSSVEQRFTPVPSNPGEEAEQSTNTPASRNKSPSHQALTPSPLPDNCITPNLPQSGSPGSSSLFKKVDICLETRSDCSNHQSSPSPEPTSKDLSLDFTQSACEPRGIVPFPLSSDTDISHWSRGSRASPELENRSHPPNSEQSSPFPEIIRRVSVPDLFSRGSTPETDIYTPGPGQVADISTAEREYTITPENQGTRPSPKPLSTASTPAPQYSPPSPVISIEPTPELKDTKVSPQIGHTSPSADLFHLASPLSAGTRSPSLLSSPVMSHSLSPSPAVTSDCSPVDHRYTSPSPEIIITASSPEVSRKVRSPEEETSDCVILEPHFDSASPRSFASSPHITGISYSVVHPEDRDTSPFPELSRLSSPDPEKTAASSKTIPTPDSLSGLTGTTEDSLHDLLFNNTVEHSEIINSPIYQTPSPKPITLTPLSDSKSHSIAVDNYPSASPQLRSNTPSPVFTSTEQGHYQHSLENFPATDSSDYCPLETPKREWDSSSAVRTEAQYPAHQTEPSVSADRGDTPGTEIKHESPVAVAYSPAKAPPVLAEEKAKHPQNQQRQEIEVIPQEVHFQDNYQKKKINYNLPIKIEPLSPDPDSEDSYSVSPHWVAPTSPVVSLGTPQSTATSCSPTFENNSLFKSSSTPEYTQGQESSSDRITEEMSYRQHRRRTPSPPITRFTPVHIIAPQKPQRHWQNSSRSPSQVVASSASRNLKKAVTNRESPDVATDVNNSPAYWGRLGTQLEIEREMQLEEVREVDRERLMERRMERHRHGEEHLPEKGKGWKENASYREEQVELSFSYRNRKGSPSGRGAHTSRQTSKAAPTVHSYSESLHSTRQQKPQQKVIFASQQDNWGGGPGRRLQPPASHNKNRASGRVAVNKLSQSSSSSMGSELDEADNEVNWFTDVAFSTLSSPELDYLDMYNSSHCSSTNISQMSTQESPAGVSAALHAYADFRDSAPNNDDFFFQQPSASSSDGTDPSRHFELGSFECIDVAVEREEYKRSRRGVPKRQIQLKRKDSDESSHASSLRPVRRDVHSAKDSNKEVLLRQHSTPVAMPECLSTDFNRGTNQHQGRKSNLQKSASLDESCTKTKMATCLINNVLSKKMHSVDPQLDEKPGENRLEQLGFEESNPQGESVGQVLKDPLQLDGPALSSSLQSDYSLLSEDLCMGEEPSPKDEVKETKHFGGRSSFKPSLYNSSKSKKTESGGAETECQQTGSFNSEIISGIKAPFDNKRSETNVQREDDAKTRGGSQNEISKNITAGNVRASEVSSMEARATDGEECDKQGNHKEVLQSDRATLEPKVNSPKEMDKKKTCLSVSLTPETENRQEAFSQDSFHRDQRGRVENNVEEKTEKDEGKRNNQTKAPIHKVRDVRRLVKNTYNLSFKATGTAQTSAATEDVRGEFNEDAQQEMTMMEKREVRAEEAMEVRQEITKGMCRDEREVSEIKTKQREEEKGLVTLSQPGNAPVSRPQPMQIEYRAVCWKEHKQKLPSCSLQDSDNDANMQDDTSGDSDMSKSSQHELNVTAEVPPIVTEVQKVQGNKGRSVELRREARPPMLGSLPKQPSKEREVSTAVVLIRDGSSKTKTSVPTNQERQTTPPSASHSPGPAVPGGSGHSVSMLLKEKGYQADIGAVVGDHIDNEAAGKKIPCKHVNSLKIPLQNTVPSDVAHIQSQNERKLSRSFNKTGPPAVSNNSNAPTKKGEDDEVGNRPTVRDTTKQKSTSLLKNSFEQTPLPTKQKAYGDFEAVKRLDPTFPPRSPALRRFRSQPIEVKSVSKETKKQEMPASSSGSRPQSIEVKSIAKKSQKPVVPPKPSCKFKPATDLGLELNESQRPSLLIPPGKPQSEDRPQTIVVSSPTIYRKISNDLTSASNNARKLSVSAIASLKPPTCRTAEPSTSTLADHSAAASRAEVLHDSPQEQTSGASPQSAGNIQRPTSFASASSTVPPISAIDPEPGTNQVPEPAVAEATHQPNQPVTELDNPPERSPMVRPRQPASLNNTNQPAAGRTHLPGYTHQPYHQSISREHSHLSDDLQFYASDDPPSYDERESFSPLMPPDLPSRRINRCQPSSRPPPCPCAAGGSSYAGPTSHRHRSPHNPTPPAPPHSPGQAPSCTLAQPPLHLHQGRYDPQQMSYQPGSPKSSPVGPNQPSALYQPVHQPHPCLPHPSLIQACPSDRPLQPFQHNEARRPSVRRSPQQQPPGIAGAPYSSPGHSHSPGLSHVDPQYMCGPQSLSASYGSEYGGDTSSLYSESTYGQTPRRVLLDPETGKYFYIEMPVQPLRKMLFDPETGQYVEVLIPQQTMSHSGLYPPSAAPYPPLHNPNMYAPAQQYIPYTAPPLAHPQSQTQPPRYPEASAAAPMHQSGPGVTYRNPSGQPPKPELQSHPPLNQSYLESMYYVPTGMSASPNPTPPDYYKHPPNLPPTRGERS